MFILAIDIMEPTIYAELLLNIRQVSVVASLPSEPDTTTQAEVFADGTRIGIRHGQSSKDILLPGRVSVHGRLPIQKSGRSPRSLSWRFPLAASHPSQGLLAQDPYPTPPWTSVDLEPGTPITCRQCGTVFVPAGTITVWKDLPSENWAEMMEFWHCHKPDPENNSHQDHDHLTKRGYGASATISAQAAVGFVDLASFLILESDATNLKVGTTPLSPSVFLCLASCTRADITYSLPPGVQEGGRAGSTCPSVAWSSIHHPKSKLQCHISP